MTSSNSLKRQVTRIGDIRFEERKNAKRWAIKLMRIALSDTEKILNGLSYIHHELNIYHGHLNYRQLLLDRKGHIKIGMTAETSSVSWLTYSSKHWREYVNEQIFHGTIWIKRCQKHWNNDDGINEAWNKLIEPWFNHFTAFREMERQSGYQKLFGRNRRVKIDRFEEGKNRETSHRQINRLKIINSSVTDLL